MEKNMSKVEILDLLNKGLNEAQQVVLEVASYIQEGTVHCFLVENSTIGKYYVTSVSNETECGYYITTALDNLERVVDEIYRRSELHKQDSSISIATIQDFEYCKYNFRGRSILVRGEYASLEDLTNAVRSLRFSNGSKIRIVLKDGDSELDIRVLYGNGSYYLNTPDMEVVGVRNSEEFKYYEEVVKGIFSLVYECYDYEIMPYRMHLEYFTEDLNEGNSVEFSEEEIKIACAKAYYGDSSEFDLMLRMAYVPEY